MIFAVDIGTTYFKASVVDITGEIVHSARVRVEVTGDREIKEANPRLWVEAFFSIYYSIPIEARKNLEAIVISGNGPTILPVDFSGKPLGNASLWMDSRSNEVASELRGKLGESVPNNFYLSKVYWYKKKLNEIYNKAQYFLSCPEYLCYALTGNAYTLLPGEGFLPYYWDDNKLNTLNIDKKKLPGFIGLYDVYGHYNSIPVICAGPDFLMSVLGSGSLEHGIVCDRTGTSEGLNYCSNKYLEIPGLRTLPHVIPGLYTLAALIPDSGDLVNNNREEELVEKYSNQLSIMIDHKLDIKEIRVIGGHSANEKLNLSKSKVIDKPLKIYKIGSELIGNAALGFFVLGRFESIIEACNSMVKEVSCYNG